MDTPAHRLKDLNIPRGRGPIVAVVLDAEALRDRRYDLVDVELLDPRVDVDGVGVEERGVLEWPDHRERQLVQGGKRVLIRGGVATGLGFSVRYVDRSGEQPSDRSQRGARPTDGRRRTPDDRYAPWKVSISLRNHSSHDPAKPFSVSSGKPPWAYVTGFSANWARSMRSRDATDGRASESFSPRDRQDQTTVGQRLGHKQDTALSLDGLDSRKMMVSSSLLRVDRMLSSDRRASLL